jgi:hypothetical protein
MSSDANKMYGPGTYWLLKTGNMLIVGEGLDSPYEEDMQYIEKEREEGHIYGAWYSDATFGGYELGTNPAQSCIEIYEPEFLLRLSQCGCKRYKGESYVSGATY